MPASQPSSNSSISYPDPEVAEKPVRRQFPAEYKLRVIQEGDRCTELGQIGVILRREGLYSSHLTTWRRHKERGELKGLGDNQRGRPAQNPQELKAKIDKLQQENQRLSKKLKQAELIIDIQQKTSELLGIALNPDKSDENS
ncbi:MAG: transposase [Microcystaceae cyanobacterium]